jgi:hypothetical protein
MFGNHFGAGAVGTVQLNGVAVATPTINGVVFDGSAAITVPAAAATLTGTLLDATLSANVPLKNAANVFTAIQTVTKDALAAVSTDGVVLQNTTAATAGVPVQMSPRLRLRANVWNTTTPANNTDDWFIESVPLNGAVPSGLLKFGRSLNGAGVVYAMTLNSAGSLTISGDMKVFTDANGDLGDSTHRFRDAYFSRNLWATGSLGFLSQTRMNSLIDGQLVLTTNAQTAGVGLDVGSGDAILRLRTRAHTGFATLDCLGLKASGAAGVSFGPAHPASITIVNGIVTACS